MTDTVLPQEALGQRELRNVFGRYATGVAVMTCRGPSGAPVGMTVNSFTSVSLAPPLVLWCLARSCARGAAFAAAECFGVSVLAAGQRDLAVRFARSGDGFGGLPPVTGAGGVPLLAGAAATLACRVERRVPAGDHVVVLGAVEAVTASGGPGLLFADGAFHAGPARRA